MDAAYSGHKIMSQLELPDLWVIVAVRHRKKAKQMVKLSHCRSDTFNTLFIPATKPQKRGQTLALQEDAESINHAGDGISLIGCPQNFLKSQDYWSCSLPAGNSGRVQHLV